MEFHDVCSIFPMMSIGEYQELVTDIRENGLKEPISLYHGKLIDGRNRYKACIESGIEPIFRNLTDVGDPFSFVVSLNLHRRHLTYDQRVGIALKLKEIYAIEAKKRQGTRTDLESNIVPNLEQCYGRAGEQAAEQTKVGKSTVYEMAAEQEENPNLSDQLVTGKTTVKATRKQARKRKQEQQQTAAVKTVENISRLWTVIDKQEIVPCHALITDPPYGILDEPWEPEYLESFTRDWTTRWNDCGADVILIFWSQQFLWDGRKWLDESLKDYKFQQLLVWHYPNNKSPQSRMGFKQTWEPIFFYRKLGSDRQVGVSGTDWGDDLHDFDCLVEAVPQSNFNGVNMKQHPAQKPLKVFRWLINAVTQPGEMVCDPFMGSGTSGIAAVQLKRQYIGIEIDPDYLKLATGRIALYGENGI